LKNFKCPLNCLYFYFFLKYGGVWSLKTDSLKVLAIKEKITYYDKKKQDWTYFGECSTLFKPRDN